MFLWLLQKLKLKQKLENVHEHSRYKTLTKKPGGFKRHSNVNFVWFIPNYWVCIRKVGVLAGVWSATNGAIVFSLKDKATKIWNVFLSVMVKKI